MPRVARPDSAIRPVHLAAVLVSGAAYVLAFPLPDLGVLAWAALVPLFLSARHRSPRHAFRLGYLWGIVAYGGVLWWLTTFGPVVWALTAMLVAVVPGVALLAINWVERDPGGPWIPVWIALIWTALEFLRSQGPLAFPWALLGATQHRSLPVIQIAGITGIYGVTFLVALVNGTLYALITGRGRLLPVCAVTLLLGVTLLSGAAALRDPGRTTFTAAAVQPNFITHPQVGSATPARDLADLQQLTAEAAGRGAAVVVWPETASPVDLLGPSGVLGTIGSWAKRHHVSIIATSLEGGRTNSAFAITPSGNLGGRYDKVRLVPFVETGEQAGIGLAPLPVPPARIGVTICFESIFPGLARQSVRQGAELLAVMTNDAWFDGRTAPAQHAALAPFRAIEEGRYLIRAANQGISAIFDSHGRPLARLPLEARGVITARVAPLKTLTVYARAGDTFGWAATLAAASLLLPRALAFVGEEAAMPAFGRLLANSALPFLVLTAAARLAGSGDLAIGPAVMPIPLVALLVVIILLSTGRSRAELGLGIRGFVPAAAIGLAFIGALVLVARHAFASHGARLDLVPPRGGWWYGTVVQVAVVGLALEWWLRGLVFADAVAWCSWRLAVVWSTLLGTVAVASRGAEAMVWAVAGGAALGLIRARWPQVPALALVHGAGNILLGFLIPSW